MKLGRDYKAALNDIVDELFKAASAKMTWAELAAESGLAYATVERLGNRKTKLPQLRTVWAIARAVGMEMHFRTKVRHMRRKAA